MTVEELAKECRENDCDKCPYEIECSNFEILLDGISPHEILEVLKMEV